MALRQVEVNPLTKIIALLRFVAAAEDLGVEIQGRDGTPGVDARTGWLRWLFASEQLDEVEAPVRPRPAVDLHWLLEAEDIDAPPGDESGREPQ